MRLIIVEGSNGVGKTTLLKKIRDRYDVFYVHFPLVYYRKMPAVAYLGEMLSFLRGQLGVFVDLNARPILVDRFFLSTMVYQGKDVNFVMPVLEELSKHEYYLFVLKPDEKYKRVISQFDNIKTYDDPNALENAIYYVLDRWSNKESKNVSVASPVSLVKS
ncbi:MAG: hypothetical protein QXV58_14850 [Saccharolobus sp.]|uniref:hypothetical protein n=1 Tax=Saccharolobus sp. TaxID=2100761 RepID=UPI003161EDF3